MEFVIHHLANALCKEGHSVTVIAERTAWQGVDIDHEYELARYGVPTRGLRRLALASPEALWKTWLRHRKKKFDIIHSHGVSYAGSRAVRAKRLLHVPVVMTPHGEDVQRVPEIGYGLRLHEEWNRKICKNMQNADAVTAISLAIQKELDCVDQSKVVRIPNGVHVEEYGRRRSRYLHDRLGLHHDTVVILSVGRNHAKKGYDYGIKALAILRDKYCVTNAHYVVVGKQASKHADLVSQLSLGKSVTLLEELAPGQVAECYHSADIFFSPSIIEGLSLVSIEALACGLPLLVTDVPGNADVVHDTAAGMIVRSKDPEHMAQGLNELVRQKNVREKLGKVAIEKAAAYDWRAVAKRYIEVYRNVLAGRPAASGLSAFRNRASLWQ